MLHMLRGIARGCSDVPAEDMVSLNPVEELSDGAESVHEDETQKYFKQGAFWDSGDCSANDLVGECVGL